MAVQINSEEDKHTKMTQSVLQTRIIITIIKDSETPWGKCLKT